MGKDLSGKEIGKGLTQRKDGLYQARFTSAHRDHDGNPVRRQRSFKFLEDAKDWLATESYEDRYCGINAGADMKVRDLFDVWMDQIKKDKVKESTYECYDSVWRNQLDALIGDLRVKDVKMMTVQDTINNLFERGYASRTIQNTKMLMGTMFRFAEANDMIIKNPVNSLVKIPKDNKESERAAFLTAEEADDLKENIEGDQYRNMAKLILNTGLRIGEICGLMWKDIDFEKREIHVRRTAYRSQKEKRMMLGDPKTKKSIRTIPMTEEAYEALIDEKKNRRQHGSKIMNIESADIVFKNEFGDITDRSGFNQALKAYGKRHGLQRFSAHTLRHTFATRCVEAGVDYKTIQELMGHSSLRITMDTYVHVDGESKKKGIAILEKAMRKIG